VEPRSCRRRCWTSCDEPCAARPSSAEYGPQITSAEDGAGWLAFFRDLTARGLTGVQLVTSDAHAGLVTAIGATLPGAGWQRCRTHYAANLMAATPKASRPWVRALLHSVYDQPDATSVHAQFDRVLDTLADKLPKVAEHLEATRADVLAFTAFPKEVGRQIWSNNLLRAAQPGDPQAHRGGRHLPRPRLRDPPRGGGELLDHWSATVGVAADGWTHRNSHAAPRPEPGRLAKLRHSGRVGCHSTRRARAPHDTLSASPAAGGP
jgi:hypothetical protein